MYRARASTEQLGLDCAGARYMPSSMMLVPKESLIEKIFELR
jgi:hypothetical protein